MRHGDSAVHQNNMEKPRNTIIEAFKDITEGEAKIRTAELKLCAWAAQHNVPFSHFDSLIPLVKDIALDSIVVKGIKLKRTKATSIISNVLGQTQYDFLCNIMRTRKFSLLIDESTDKSSDKSLALVIRCFCGTEQNDYFFGLLEVTEANAKALYQLIIDKFKSAEIPYVQNMIGFGSDNASVMQGQNLSVAALFRKEIPDLLTMGCVCHTFDLIMKAACKKLPDFLEKMIRGAYTVLSRSPKKRKEYEFVQEMCNESVLRLLNVAKTRWLSLQLSVETILLRYESLKIYFATSLWDDDDEGNTAKFIYKSLDNPFTKMYLSVLKFVFYYVNKLNRLFQSESPQITGLHSAMEGLFRTILDWFINDKYLQNLSDISKVKISNENFKNIEDMYLGAEAETLITRFLEKHPSSIAQIESFKLIIRSFYEEMSRQIYKRFDFNDKKIKLLSLIDTSNISNKLAKNRTTSIGPLVSIYKNLVPPEKRQEIDLEFRLIRNADYSEIMTETERNDTILFWKAILNLKDSGQNYRYPLMREFVFDIFSLPHSSACVERIFSQVNLNKTCIRNKLGPKSLSGILMTKDMIKRLDGLKNLKYEKNMSILYETKNLYKGVDESNDDKNE